MNGSKKVFFWALAGLLICSGYAFAKEVQGKITGVNTHENFIIAQTLDETGKTGPMRMLKVSNDTRLDGIKSLKELSVGDVVTFDAIQEKSGAWKLKTLLSTKPLKANSVPVSSSGGGGSAMAMGGYSGN